MARRGSTAVDVDVDVGGVLRMEAATNGLDQALNKLQHTVGATFTDKTALQYAKSTSAALNKVQKSVQGVTRSMADFDELQRLNKQKTSTSSTKKTGTQLLLEMLQNYDSGHAAVTLNMISAAIEKVNVQTEVALGRMQLLDARLNAQELAVASNTAAWQVNTTARTQCATAGQILAAGATNWNNLCAASTAATMTLKTALSLLKSQQDQLCSGFLQLRTGAQTAVVSWGQLAVSVQQASQQVRASTQLIGSSVQNAFSPAVLAGLQAGFHSASAVLRTGCVGLLETMDANFLPGWRQVWLSAAAGFNAVMTALPVNLRQVANSTIDVFNKMLSGIATGYNQLINGLNRQRATLAAASGMKMSLLPGVPTPNIPKLAQGAVLPANKPFLAVVGDQRHGTNVETPLATIQEAVALVMEDQTAAIMAGFETSVQMQKAILEAVLGINIGDDVIGQASQRYAQKMAIMRGGQW